MRGSMIAASLAVVLSAAPAFAQAAGQAKPVQPPPAATAPPPQTATPPVQTVPAQKPQPPVPFLTGAKVGLVNLQLIAQNSVEGKAASSRVQALIQKKQTEGADKAKQLQANQQKLQTSGGVMTEAARAQLEKDIASQQRDNDRFEQDAQAELNDLQQTLQNDLLKKLFPILEDMRKEKELWVIFSAADAGVIVADNGLDLTLDAVKRMDAKK
jgi:Skp family chaperone for outer membrane proteins